MKQTKHLIPILLILLAVGLSGCTKDKKLFEVEEVSKIYTGGCPAGGYTIILDFALIDMYSGKNIIYRGSEFNIKDVVITAGMQNKVVRPTMHKNRDIGEYFTVSPAQEFTITVKNLPPIPVKVTWVVKTHPDKCPTPQNVKVEYSGKTLTDVADKVVKILVDTKR